jgi:hypothetical protein
MKGLGRTSKENIINDIIRVVLCIYKVKKGIYLLRLITESNDNVFYLFIVMLRLFIIIVFIFIL